MAISYVRYTADGSTPNFNVTFPYLAKSHVVVTKNDVTAPYTWVSSSVITITGGVVNGDELELRRATPQSQLANSSDGAVLTNSVLQTLSLQSIYIAQEVQDLAAEALAMATEGVEGMEDSVENSAASAAAAAASAVTAGTGATTATTKAAEAAASAVAAAASAVTASTGATTATTKAAEAVVSAAAAATSATNAATSATTAGTSAVSAIAAAAAISTYAGVGVELVAPESGLTGALVSLDGKLIAGTTSVDTPIPDQTSESYFASASARGTKIDSVTDIKNAGVITPYVSRYDGAMWLEAPAVSGATLVAKINWDKRGSVWRDITIGSTSLTLTSGLASDVMFISPSFGQSLSQGNPPTYTNTAPDSTYLKMPDKTSSFRHPYWTSNHTENGLVALSHDSSLGPGYGESHIASMGLTLLTLMNTAGQKIPMVGFTCGVGGNSLRDLAEDSAPDLASSRNTQVYPHLLRMINYAKNEILALGKIPVLLPLVFIHGEEDSGDWDIGTTAKEYAAGLIDLRERFNRDMRRIFGWHRDAPGVPLLITQTRRTPTYMWSSGSKVFKRGTDGPMLGQWAASYLDPGIVMCGPNWQHSLAGDGSHLDGTGYFRMGEQIGRQMWNCVFARGPSYFRPVKAIRQSDSIVDLVFQTPSGTTLAFDTTVIADHPDGNKGFYAWNEDTNAAIAISSVAVQAADTIRITFTSAQGATVKVWIDGGLWGDTSSNVNQVALGPRLNLRTNATYSSIISSYGGAAATNYDWCPAFRVPITYYGGAPRVARLDGRL